MVEIETRFRAPARDRRTHFVNRKPAGNFLHAIQFADRLKRPLNTFVSINFTLTSTPPAEMVAAFERLRKSFFCHWFRRDARPPKSDGAPLYVWVAENANGQHGIHWLLHIPTHRRRDFEAKLALWLEEVAGLCSEGTLHVRDAPTPKGAGKYMMKGIDPHYAAFYGVRPSPQGEIVGKRSGFSRALGPAARLRAASRKGTRHWRKDAIENSPTDDGGEDDR